MAAEVLFAMGALTAIAALRIVRKRRRLPGERLGQWLVRVRRHDLESGYKDLMLLCFGFGLCIAALLFQFRQDVAELERPAQMLLGLLCASFTVALPLLVWLTGKEGRKRLADEDEQWRRVEEEAREERRLWERHVRERDGEDLDGR